MAPAAGLCRSRSEGQARMMRVRFSLPHRGLLCLVAAAVLACASCSSGPPLYPVKGKVLHKGQPLKDAVVTFHPKGDKSITTVLPVGKSGEDGSFSLITGVKEGAPAGEYVVTVICPEETKLPKGKISTAPPESRDRFEGAYANRETSTLRAEIKPGANELNPFELK
jgi:hypothetical protein